MLPMLSPMNPNQTMSPYNTYPHLMLMLSLSNLSLSLILNSYNTTFMMEWTFVAINSSKMSLPIMLDSMSTLFISTVTFISFNVLTFSKTYMQNEMNLTRFTHILSLFIMSMILLIMSPNIISMMLGWDGLGMTSFLLVIYYQNTKSLKSGMITALTNRIGDALLLITIALVLSQGHWDLMTMWKDLMNKQSTTGLLILLASMTKSAQFPFIAWLPEAMAAPTPVSALVHSSTLVTAGMYIMIRLHPFLSHTKLFNSILLTSGLLTSLLAAYWSTWYMDAKKAVALSTLSQLGLMSISLSLNLVMFCFVHLLTHAMFKATLFMSVGMSIIMKHHSQRKDNLRMIKTMPTVSAAAAMSLLSMNAFFFLAGYYSKEIILETSIFNPWTSLTLLSLGASAMSTILYSIPLWQIYVMSSLNKNQYPYNTNSKPQEWYANSTNKTMITPMILMATGSISMGSITFWMFISPSETPILPNLLHLSPWIWMSMGLYLATKIHRLTTKKPLPVMSFKKSPSTNMTLMKPYPFHHAKLTLNYRLWLSMFYYKSLYLPSKNTNHPYCSKKIWWMFNLISFLSMKPGSMQRNSENLAGVMTMSYNTSIPFINTSMFTIKTLDQGIIMLTTTENLKFMIPQLSKMILSHQSNQTTKSILMFISTISLLLLLLI